MIQALSAKAKELEEHVAYSHDVCARATVARTKKRVEDARKQQELEEMMAYQTTAAYQAEMARKTEAECEAVRESISKLEERLQELQEENVVLKEAVEEHEYKQKSRQLMSGVGDAFLSLAVLDFSIKMRMNPLQLQKAGFVVQKMKASGYNSEQINTVCRSVLLI